MLGGLTKTVLETALEGELSELHVLADTGVLGGKTRRALNSTVLDDAVGAPGHGPPVDRRDPPSAP